MAQKHGNLAAAHAHNVRSLKTSSGSYSLQSVDWQDNEQRFARTDKSTYMLTVVLSTTGDDCMKSDESDTAVVGGQ